MIGKGYLIFEVDDVLKETPGYYSSHEEAVREVEKRITNNSIRQYVIQEVYHWSMV